MTHTPTFTATFTATNTPTNTPTFTPTYTPTYTATNTATFTPTPYLALSKNVNVTQPHPLDTIVYSLVYLNGGSVPVGPVTLTDNLPTTLAETYVTGSAAGATFDSVANTLTWVIPTIPGESAATLTYQMQVALTGSSYNPVVNNAVLAYAGGSVPASSSVNVIGDYKVHVAVYNSAGEKVGDITSFETGTAITDFSLSTTSITSASQSVSIYYNGIYLGQWNGTGTNGQKVTNGTYYLKIDTTDPVGVTTSVTKNINVEIVQSTLQITIFNEAGEAVTIYDTQQIEAMQSGGSLQASDYNLGLMQMSPGILTPSYTSPTASGSELVITLGGGEAVTWDGRNGLGAIVTSGNYFIEIRSFVPGQATQEIIRQVTVINHGQGAQSGVVLAPNPVSLRLNSQAVFRLFGLSPDVASSQAKVYTVAGELVAILANDPGGPSTITWNFGGKLASGTYICVVEMKSAAKGVIDRHILKAVLIH